MLIIVWESHFKRDFKNAEKRNKDISKLEEVLKYLQNRRPLQPKYKDHKLKGTYIGCRECHIEPDWLLVYKTNKTQLILVRMGSHSDLF